MDHKTSFGKIFISYSWKHEGGNNEFADLVEAELKSQNFEVIRDKTFLDYLDSLPSYMKTLAQGYVIVIINHNYFTSANCMFEMCEMLRHHFAEKRVFPIILNDIKEIRSEAGVIDVTNKYSAYWKNEKDKIETTISQANFVNPFDPNVREFYVNKEEILKNLSHFIKLVGRDMIDFTESALVEDNLKSLSRRIESRISEDFRLMELQSVNYQNRLIPKDSQKIVCFTQKYWEEQRNKNLNEEQFNKYFTHAQSNAKGILPSIIANNKHIDFGESCAVTTDSQQEETIREIGDILREAAENNFSLIKLTGEAGEGKSTFLFHVAMQRFRDYNMIYIQEENIENLFDLLPTFDNTLPVMIIIDEIARHSQKIKDYADAAYRKYNGSKTLFFVVERRFLYSTMANRREFEEYFYANYSITHTPNKEGLLELFKKLYFLLNVNETGSSSETKDNAEKIFLRGTTKTIVDRIKALIDFLNSEHKINIRQEWDDWYNYIDRQNNRFSPLKNLFLLVSTFFQFGVGVPVGFCSRRFNVDPLELIGLVSPGDNSESPFIVNRSDNIIKLELHHSSRAIWFLEKGSNRINSEIIFKDFATNAFDDDSMYLLRNLYRNNEFNSSYLKRNLPDNRVLELFKRHVEDYVQKNLPINPKNIIELGIAFQQLKKDTEASKEAYRLAIKLFPNEDTFGRNLLSSLLIQERSFGESEKLLEARQLLTDVLTIDEENIQARILFSRIYIEEENWSAAENEISKVFEYENEINPRSVISPIFLNLKIVDKEKIARFFRSIIECVKKYNYPALKYTLTMISKILRVNKCFSESRVILEEYLKEFPADAHIRTELGIDYRELKEFQLAESILEEARKISPENIHTLGELGRLYQDPNIKKYGDAEAIYRYILAKIDSTNTPVKTQLAKLLYEHYKKYEEAIALLKENLKIQPEHEHSKTELALVYQKTGQLDEAVKILREFEDKKGFYFATQQVVLGYVYIKMHKFDAARRVLYLALKNNEYNLPTYEALYTLFDKTADNDSIQDLLQNVKTKPEIGSKIVQIHAQNLIERDRLDEAVIILKNQLHYEDNILLTSRLASLYLQIGRENKKIKRGMLQKSLDLILNAQGFEKSEGCVYLLYEIYKDKNIREEMNKWLAVLYSLNKVNARGCVALAKYFEEVNKFRVAIKLLRAALKSDSKNLHLLSQMFGLYKKVKDVKGMKWILSQTELHYEKNSPGVAQNLYLTMCDTLKAFNKTEILVELHNIGVYNVKQNPTKIIAGKKTFQLKLNPVICNNSLESTRVYFATYREKDMVEANFIEPYFESINDLKSFFV